MKKNLILIFLLITTVALAQKKSLTHETYDEWNKISDEKISHDGNFVLHTVNPDVGDGKLVILNAKSQETQDIPRGAKVKITRESTHAIFHIYPPHEMVKEMRREKKKREDLPKDSLGIFDLKNFKLVKIPEVKSYKIPEKADGYLAYQLEKEPKSSDSTQEAATKGKRKKPSSENGFPLVIRNLSTGVEIVYPYVKEYSFANYGQALFFTSTGNDSTFKAGVYRYSTENENLQLLFEGNPKEKWENLASDETGRQLAFVADVDTTKALVRKPRLYYWKVGIPAATTLADETSDQLPANWLISANFSPYFSKDGDRLFFGVNPTPLVQDTTLLEEEIVKVEVWHWQDEYIYPEQNQRADRERKRSYLAVVNPGDRKMVMLGSKKIPQIEVADEGKGAFALGVDDQAYRMMRTWDISAFKDLYAVDISSGESRLITEKLKGNASLSPDALYVYWYNLQDTAWYTHHLPSAKTTKVTAGLSVSFANERDDHPDYPYPYGVAGWTKSDKQLLIYDRYDIWAFDPQGGLPAQNLTRTGRDTKTVYRYIPTDKEIKYIDATKDLLLSSFHEPTKFAGFSSLSLRRPQVKTLVSSGHRYSFKEKARSADHYLFSRENFEEFPDLQLTDSQFKKPKKISNANPQQKDYKWGTVELVNWRSLDNLPLEGLLYKPEDFDPNKEYPMVIFYYERFADRLYQHHVPEALRSAINRTVYVSNDYLVFIPDVVYRIGYPGESALNCIMPGVTELISRGFVDADNIAISGHSWSGYQTAYMLTRTNMFKAAEAGAIVANMTSAYGGIRWQTGLARMFQYERSQTRLGASLWEKPMLYLENSPLFTADKIETPLLLMHNDADGHVPWYQGIEMYLAMRRLDKPCWMLNYNGEPHWPVKRENRVDFQIRMMQFFDYYLKDKPMPQWMKRGVPAVEKGILQGYEYVDEP